MIPGRIRNQGIELYEQGLVDIVSKQEEVIQADSSITNISYLTINVVDFRV